MNQSQYKWKHLSGEGLERGRSTLVGGGVSVSPNHVSLYLRVGVGNDTCIVLLIERNTYFSINRTTHVSFY